MADQSRLTKLSSTCAYPAAWIAQYKSYVKKILKDDSATANFTNFSSACDIDVYATLLATGVLETDSTWAALEAMIMLLWGPKGGEQAARTSALQRRQGPSETVASFASDFARLVHAIPGQKVDGWIDQFRASLRQSIATAMVASTTETWIDAVAMAGRVEASEALMQPAQAAPAEPAVIGQFGRRPDGGARGECWYCHKPGHKRADCHARKRAETKTGHKPSYASSSSSSFYQVKRVIATLTANNSNGTTLSLPVRFPGRKAEHRALVDSGAEVCAVSSDLARQCGLHPRRDGGALVAVDGSPLRVLGTVRTSAIVAGRRTDTTFVVVDGLTVPLILGRDFLRDAGAVIDFKRARVSVDTPAAQAPADGCPYPSPSLREAKEIFSFQAPASPEPSIGREQILRQLTLGTAVPSAKIRAVLSDFAPCFALDPEQFGNARVEPLRLVVHTDIPIRSYPYRLSLPDNDFAEAEIAKWLAAGRIRPSVSPWASPVHVVPKDGDGKRLVVDFSRLNKFVQADNQPAPRARDIFDSLAGTKIFSKIDFQSAYLQIPVDPDSRHFFLLYRDRVSTSLIAFPLA